jgi:hypothetical protein
MCAVQKFAIERGEVKSHLTDASGRQAARSNARRRSLMLEAKSGARTSNAACRDRRASTRNLLCAS